MIEITNKENRYLLRNSENLYLSGLFKALESLMPFMSKKQKNKLFKDLQVDGKTFDEAKYLQAACETSIASYLSSRYSDSFIYEPKLKPPKDVDCGFKINEKMYNIEVKCPDFSKQNQIESSNAFKLGAFGRLENFDEVFEDLYEVFDKNKSLVGNPDKPLIAQQHMDNKLKDYLLSAHSKFKDSTGPDELNLLAVCCSDWMDMQKWFCYMYDYQGLFTQESFYPVGNFNNVDVVMLTNLYHRHHEYWRKDKIIHHWDLSNSFNLIFSNPFRQKDKKEIIFSFIDAVPNYSNQLCDFQSKNGIVQMQIPHFVFKELIHKGLYYFQPNA